MHGVGGYRSGVGRDGGSVSAARALLAGLITASCRKPTSNPRRCRLPRRWPPARPPEALKVARIEEEDRHFRARLKSDEAREAFMAFMSRKKG